MRYELCENGYINKVFFGCHSGTCTLYEGAIPDGYETIEEWVQNANIRAYKIVDGNLVYDADEDARLQEEYNNCGLSGEFILYEGKLLGGEILSKDFSLYKLLKITYCCYDGSNYNGGGASNVLFLDLTKAGSNVTDYIAGNVVSYFAGDDGNTPYGTTFCIQVVVNSSKNNLKAKFAYNSTLQASEYYYISKIVGYKW